jgi:hypothetical protein
MTENKKSHTTNYFDAFIEVAEDCPVTKGEIPPITNTTKSIARLQYEMLSKNPYAFTSDDILFRVYADRNDLTESELPAAREQFFSKGQPCLRASPLTKRYGWGIHSDNKGKVAMFGIETQAYEAFIKNAALKKVKAMRSKRN